MAVWGLAQSSVFNFLASHLLDVYGHLNTVPLVVLCLLMLGAHRDSLVAGPPSAQPLVPQETSTFVEALGAGGGGTPDTPLLEADSPGVPLETKTPTEMTVDGAGAASEPMPPVIDPTAETPQLAPTTVLPGAPPQAAPVPAPTPSPTVVFVAAPAGPAPAGVAGAAPPVQPQPTVTPGPAPANVSLDADVSVVSLGQTVTVQIEISAGPGSPVDAAQVYLDFDASVLQVIGLTDGAALPVQLQSSYDNAAGEVNYAAGTLGPPIASPFILATVQFQAIDATGGSGTTIDFAPRANPRWTKAVADGRDITGGLAGANLLIE